MYLRLLLNWSVCALFALNIRTTTFCNYSRTTMKLKFLDKILCKQLEVVPAHAMKAYTRGADKSLARPTSLSCRTESIMSLKRGVCSCAELQVFSCYRGWKEACQTTRAISATWRCELSSSFFFARQGAKGNSHHSEGNIRRTCAIICQRQKMGGPI